MHEGQVTSSTMGDALDIGTLKDRELADPSLRFPHLAIAKRKGKNPRSASIIPLENSRIYARGKGCAKG